MRGMSDTAMRPGRKPRPANQGQRASLGLKVTAEIKNKLDAAAKANGRTQSQEAEVRIEKTFERGTLLSEVVELALGERPASLLLVLTRVIDDVGKAAGYKAIGAPDGARNWLSNAGAFEQVRQAI